MPLLQRLVGILVAIPLLVAAFLFAWVVFIVAVAAALVLGAWFWWKTRHVRRAMEQHAAQPPRQSGGAVIEGEYRVERGEIHANEKLP
jgi:hypothetical protein